MLRHVPLLSAGSTAAVSEAEAAPTGRVDISASCLTSWLRVIGASFNRSVVLCPTKIDLRARFFKTSSDGIEGGLAAVDSGMGGDHMPFLLCTLAATRCWPRGRVLAALIALRFEECSHTLLRCLTPSVSRFPMPPDVRLFAHLSAFSGLSHPPKVWAYEERRIPIRRALSGAEQRSGRRPASWSRSGPVRCSTATTSSNTRRWCGGWRIR